MKKKRHTPEEVIKKLREAEGLIAAGKGVDGGAFGGGYSNHSDGAAGKSRGGCGQGICYYSGKLTSSTQAALA